MKKYLFLLCLVWNVINVQAARTIICGQFVSVPPDVVNLQFYASQIAAIEKNRTTLRHKPGENGTFKFVVDTDIPLRLNLSYGQRDACGGAPLFSNKYILPGDSLHVVFSDTSINIEGSCETYMSFQFDYDMKFHNDDSISADTNLRKLSCIAFAETMSNRLAYRLQYFDDYFAGKPVPDLFRTVYRAHEELDFGTRMVQFPWTSKTGRTAFNDTAYWRYLRKIDFNNPDYRIIPSYWLFANQLAFGVFVTIQNTVDSNKRFEVGEHVYFICDSVARVHLKPVALDYALYGFLQDKIRFVKTNIGSPYFDVEYRLADSTMKVLGSHMSDTMLFAKAMLLLRMIKEPRQPAPDFTAHDINGKEVKLSDLKGKVVYIDFWATSCAPCVAELPYIKRLQEHYKSNEDIVMLYVSFDNNPMALQKFLKEKSFDGLHWVDGRSFASEAAEKYKISGIPRYVVVDREGLLVTADAQRPSGDPYAVLNTVLNEGK
jgi:thiol-disulfide isomerase/thioredoxin